MATTRSQKRSDSAQRRRCVAVEQVRVLAVSVARLGANWKCAGTAVRRYRAVRPCHRRGSRRSRASSRRTSAKHSDRQACRRWYLAARCLELGGQCARPARTRGPKAPTRARNRLCCSAPADVDACTRVAHRVCGTDRMRADDAEPQQERQRRRGASPSLRGREVTRGLPPRARACERECSHRSPTGGEQQGDLLVGQARRPPAAGASRGSAARRCRAA